VNPTLALGFVATAAVTGCAPPYYALAARGDALASPSRRVALFTEAPAGTQWCRGDPAPVTVIDADQQSLTVALSQAATQVLATDEKGRTVALSAELSGDLGQTLHFVGVRLDTPYAVRPGTLRVSSPSLCAYDRGWIVAWHERASLDRSPTRGSDLSNAVGVGIERMDGESTEGVTLTWVAPTPQELSHFTLARLLAGRRDARVSGVAIGVTPERRLVVRVTDAMGADTTTRYLVSQPLRTPRAYGLDFLN